MLDIKREFMMKTIFSILGLAVLLFGLVACGGGDSSSSSGGGGDLNLNGSWRVHHHFDTNGEFIQTYTLTLQQTGDNVIGTNFTPDPGPGPSPAPSCDSTITEFKGTVSGNTFNGSVKTDIYSETLTVTGTSNYLSGDFRVTYTSGACIGVQTGNLIMTRI